MGRPSVGEYPDNWDEIANQVKEAAHWRCIRCGHAHDVRQGFMLTVHHLDLNKSNVAWWNLAALCQRCHLRIQGKVVMERTWMFAHSGWFVPYVAGYYAHQFGLPEDRPWVEDHAEILILMGQGLAWDQKLMDEIERSK